MKKVVLMFKVVSVLDVKIILFFKRPLQDILKYTEKAGEDPSELKKALRVMCIVPKAANDMMQVGRLQGFDVSFILIHSKSNK